MAEIIKTYVNKDQGGRVELHSRPSFSPLSFLSAAYQIRFENGRTFTVGIAGAYNAMGLIGTEANGVFVCDDDSERVVVTGVARAASGYQTPTKDQLAILDGLLVMPWGVFKNWVNGLEQDPPHTGRRYDL
jgi:hypothetical protein